MPSRLTVVSHSVNPFVPAFFHPPPPAARKEATISHIEEPETSGIQPIVLSNPLPASDDDFQDNFVWAVLYENQRGSVLLWHMTYCMLIELG